MPQKFKFEENVDGEWNTMNEEILNSTQCTGISKNGQRCKRVCIIGYEYCPTHLEQIKHLKIKNSSIPNAGKGLFAFDRKKGQNEIIFKKDNTIIDYNGQVKTGTRLQEEYGDYTAPYAVEMKTTEMEDEDGEIVLETQNIDAGGKRGVASLANHKPQSQTNARLTVKKQNNQIVGVQIKANKNIRNGSEIFVNYGNKYYHDEPTRHSTKPFRPRIR